jgi:hypothetical protein
MQVSQNDNASSRPVENGRALSCEERLRPERGSSRREDVDRVRFGGTVRAWSVWHAGMLRRFGWDVRRRAFARRPREGPNYRQVIMIRSIGPLRPHWTYTQKMRLPRSGTPTGALSDQLSALARRHQLRRQQEDIQAGLVDYEAMPPYPPRPRPPS